MSAAQLLLRPVPAPDREADAAERRALEHTWEPPKGFIGWLSRVDHKSVARRYIITAFLFFLAGGVLALLMRIQLSRPEARFLGPDLYNQVFTVHGSTMMFLFAVPIMEAMGLYFVPLMIGTRNVAFPRLNAFGYFVYLFGGLMLYGMFLLNTGPDAGWFNYVPLAGPEYSPGKRVDVWAQLVNFTELAALIGAVELIVTTLKMRAPGMSINRMPLFVWSMLIMAFMIIFAMPSIMTTSTLIAMDRLVATQFFNQSEGGDPLLWQHLFWFFGHPEVYIIFIPALGMVSTILAAMCRRPVFGYPAMVLALLANGFIGFGLWVHHMFATPLPQMGQSFFTAASMIIAIPSGLQIFCWIATMWSSRPRFTPPLLFVLSFVVIFVLGGLTGVMLASVPLDLQLHDTFFVVAHFHYVLIGGAVFPLFGAFHYWFPKFTGRMLDPRLSYWTVALMFVGFNLTFFPMHLLGLEGMPRRVYTYLPETGWGGLNMLATAGGVILALGVLVFIVNALKSRYAGAPAGDNPWDADTLEWGTSSPAPSYNFQKLPVVQGRNGLWSRTADAPVVDGLRTDCPEVLVTFVLDAEPDHRYTLPTPSLWPFLTALALSVMFIWLLFSPWGLVWGGSLVGLCLIIWFWPESEGGETRDPAEVQP